MKSVHDNTPEAILELSVLKHMVDKKTIALEAALTEVTRSNTELEQFAFIASHELQEPLRKIVSFGNLLSEYYGHQLDAKGTDYLDRMKSAAKRMQSQIDNLLRYSRISTEDITFEPVNLNELVKKMAIDFDEEIRSDGGILNIDQLPEIQGDALQLRQLFLNLIGNAIKFRHRNRPLVININTTFHDKEVIIKISDNGIGFEQSQSESIFGIFHRLHGDTRYSGSGIGLAICRRIVRRHSGAICAFGNPGKGACFHITFSKYPIR
ncbi:MAG: hypothetical protein JXR76_18845 [Deltaproteobacteria bacterium]|nr:hypothetical protein [Deltaproteobacteria bacterium]